MRASSSEQRIRLGGVFGGVRPETVEVRLNGRGLTRGTDYNVDFIGNVTFVGNVSQEVADPGAELEISFESEDLLGLEVSRRLCWVCGPVRGSGLGTGALEAR